MNIGILPRPQAEPSADLHIKRLSPAQSHRLVHQAIDGLDLSGLAAAIEAANHGSTFTSALAEQATRALALRIGQLVREFE
jgi:hypothetical protein